MHNIIKLSYHILKLSHNVIKLSHNIIKLSHNIINSSHNMIKWSHNIIELSHNIIKLPHNLSKLSHNIISFLYVLCKKLWTSTLKPVVRNENDLAEMVLRWPSKYNWNIDPSKKWPPDVLAYHSMANFKNILLWNWRSEFKIIQ